MKVGSVNRAGHEAVAGKAGGNSANGVLGLLDVVSSRAGG
jgi:hypothetical protein